MNNRYDDSKIKCINTFLQISFVSVNEITSSEVEGRRILLEVVHTVTWEGHPLVRPSVARPLGARPLGRHTEEEELPSEEVHP